MPDILTKRPDGFFTTMNNMTLEGHRMILFLSSDDWMTKCGRMNNDGTLSGYVFENDFCWFIGTEQNPDHPVSSKTCMALAKTPLAIVERSKDGIENVIHTHWLENCRDDGKAYGLAGMTAMDLHLEVFDFLLQMNDMLSLPQGTGGGWDGLKAAQSPYTFQFYRFFKFWLLLGHNDITLPLKVVRWMLGVGAGQWKYYAVFKKHAIAVAQAEMRQLCDVAFEYEEIAEGGHVQSLKFQFMWNPDMAGATDKLRGFYRSLNAGELSPLRDVFQEAPGDPPPLCNICQEAPAPEAEAPAMEAPAPEAEAPAATPPAPEAEPPGTAGAYANFVISWRLAALLSGLAENGLEKRDINFLFAMLLMTRQGNRIPCGTPESMAQRIGWGLAPVNESLAALTRIGVIEEKESGYYFSRKYAWECGPDGPPGP